MPCVVAMLQIRSTATASAKCRKETQPTQGLKPQHKSMISLLSVSPIYVPMAVHWFHCSLLESR